MHEFNDDKFKSADFSTTRKFNFSVLSPFHLEFNFNSFEIPMFVSVSFFFFSFPLNQSSRAFNGFEYSQWRMWIETIASVQVYVYRPIVDDAHMFDTFSVIFFIHILPLVIVGLHRNELRLSSSQRNANEQKDEEKKLNWIMNLSCDVCVLFSSLHFITNAKWICRLVASNCIKWTKQSSEKVTNDIIIFVGDWGAFAWISTRNQFNDLQHTKTHSHNSPIDSTSTSWSNESIFAFDPHTFCHCICAGTFDSREKAHTRTWAIDNSFLNRKLI